MIATGRIVEAQKQLEAARGEGKRVGFVPTMGALHAGHRSLVRRARAETDYVVVSIFVNPAQFGPHEDLTAYPRTFALDLEACAAEGAHLVFHPDADEMYASPSVTSVSVGALTETMEGAQRPGHFDGVTLVCSKLFNIIGACTAYFGEKDAQQLRVVSRMVRDLNQPVQIVPCPTVRDEDGLALSSRNLYLTADERARALALPRALAIVADHVAASSPDVSALHDAARAILDGVDVDYFEIVHPDTLEPLDRIDGAALVCCAIRVGKTRLIDNVLIPERRDD